MAPHIAGKNSAHNLPLSASLGRLIHTYSGKRQVLWGFHGAPEEIRTPDPQIRSLVLYPAELRALDAAAGLGRGTEP
jgi:hypothetical protein